MKYNDSKIHAFITLLNPESISKQRKNVLGEVIAYIQSKVDAQKAIRLCFICTHNSRRSHLAQIWAQTMAYHFRLASVSCYSAGTEATAIYPEIINRLQQTGFSIDILSEGENPVYIIKFHRDEPALIGYSKTLENALNPQSNFCALMTCDTADQACPTIWGAEQRVALSYEDPKLYDQTPQEAEMYEKRNREIATEMYYIFSQIHHNKEERE